MKRNIKTVASIAAIVLALVSTAAPAKAKSKQVESTSPRCPRALRMEGKGLALEGYVGKSRERTLKRQGWTKQQIKSCGLQHNPKAVRSTRVGQSFTPPNSHPTTAPTQGGGSRNNDFGKFFPPQGDAAPSKDGTKGAASR